MRAVSGIERGTVVASKVGSSILNFHFGLITAAALAVFVFVDRVTVVQRLMRTPFSHLVYILNRINHEKMLIGDISNFNYDFNLKSKFDWLFLALMIIYGQAVIFIAFYINISTVSSLSIFLMNLVRSHSLDAAKYIMKRNYDKRINST